MMHRVEFVREKVLMAQVNAEQWVAVASQSFSGGIPQRDVNTSGRKACCELFQLEGTPTRRGRLHTQILGDTESGNVCRRDLSSALPTPTRVHVPQEHLPIVRCFDMHVAIACSASGVVHLESLCVPR